jgi:hypothetical protein
MLVPENMGLLPDGAQQVSLDPKTFFFFFFINLEPRVR